jgi:hypothetical protein
MQKRSRIPNRLVTAQHEPPHNVMRTLEIFGESNQRKEQDSSFDSNLDEQRRIHSILFASLD